jgi:hypothetical protein
LDIHGVAYAPEADWDPPWYQRLFGILTIAQPQTKTRLAKTGEKSAGGP